MTKQSDEWVRPTQRQSETRRCSRRERFYGSEPCRKMPVVAVAKNGVACRCAACAKLDGIAVSPMRKAKKRKPEAKVTTWSGWGVLDNGHLITCTSIVAAKARIVMNGSGTLVRVKDAPLEEVR